MTPLKQCQPFLIHTILTPAIDSSFIHKLIFAYSQQLSEENPHFQPQFKEKQEKMSRHNDQLKLLNQIKQDYFLREQVLQEILLQDYLKQYQALVETNCLSQQYQKPLTYRLQPSHKDYRSFHLGNHQPKSKENSIQVTKLEEKSMFAKQQPTKKFRSSLIKSGSFSSIKNKTTPFSNQSNNTQQSLRNSSDSQGLIHDENPKNRPILKKKVIKNLEQQPSQLQKVFVRNKEVVKNSILENYQEEEQQKLMKLDVRQKEMENNGNQESFEQKGESPEEEKTTQRMHLNTTQKKLPQVCLKQSTLGKSKDTQKQKGRSGNKSYLKDNKQNPYHISNFLRNLNSYHYVSQYNQVKHPTKRGNVKRD